MAASDIAVSALTAVPTVKGNALTITTSDPRSGALLNLALDRVDIYGSTTDTFASASVVTQGTVRAVHPDAGEETTWYYWGIPYDKLGGAGTRYPAGATGGVSCTSLGQAGTTFALSNGKIVVSVASNNLTVSVKTLAGTDPSASDKIYVSLRNATGSYTLRSITAALSVTILQGSHLATHSPFPFRIWVALFDDAGTVRLAVQNVTTFNTGTSGLLYQLPGSGIASVILDAGASGLAQNFYGNATITSKWYRLIGFAEWQSGLAVNGNWNVLPDVTEMIGPDTRLPGTVVQQSRIWQLAFAATAGTIPWDDTIPQITEGANLLTGQSMIPTTPVNYAEIIAEVVGSCSVAEVVTLAIFRGSTADAIAAKGVLMPTIDKPGAIHLRHIELFNTTSAVTFTVRVGGETGTFGRNGTSAARKLGGIQANALIIREMMA